MTGKALPRDVRLSLVEGAKTQPVGRGMLRVYGTSGYGENRLSVLLDTEKYDILIDGGGNREKWHRLFGDPPKADALVISEPLDRTGLNAICPEILVLPAQQVSPELLLMLRETDYETIRPTGKRTVLIRR